jgi:hypothetical protein
MEFASMTVSSCEQPIARNSTISSPAQALSGAAAADHLLLNTKVSYAPLAVWKNFHWTCTVTSVAPVVQDRLE